MNTIVLNKSAMDKTICSQADDAIHQITLNAKDGKPTTDLYLPKEIFHLIRKKIHSHMEKTNTKYCWVTMEGMSSLPWGDQRHLKFRLL